MYYVKFFHKFFTFLAFYVWNKSDVVKDTFQPLYSDNLSKMQSLTAVSYYMFTTLTDYATGPVYSRVAGSSAVKDYREVVTGANDWSFTDRSIYLCDTQCEQKIGRSLIFALLEYYKYCCCCCCCCCYYYYYYYYYYTTTTAVAAFPV